MNRLLPDFRLAPWIFGFMLLGLALPRAIVERSLRRYLQGLAVACFGALVPVTVFLLSAFLVPEWKGGCELGWLDCFHLGKLALLPLVLWATAALYAVEMSPAVNRSAPWIITGLWTGAIVAGVCFVYGVVSVGARTNNGRVILFLAVPFYIAIWHGARALQLSRRTPVSAVTCRLALLGPLPLWILGLFWSRRIFAHLPDTPPSCFVVTAAARGHISLVGPFIKLPHRGRTRRANRQLLRLWEFETLWQTRAPRSHATFRRIYNHIGPAIARRITLPWLADLAYIGIKPMELFAAFVLRIARARCNAAYEDDDCTS